MRNRFAILLLFVSYNVAITAESCMPVIDIISKQYVSLPEYPNSIFDKKSKAPKNETEDSVSILKDSLSVVTDSLSILKDSITVLVKTNRHQQKSETHTRRQSNTLQIQVDSLQRELKRLENAMSDQIVTTFGEHLTDGSAFFCRAVMESPLFYKYDADRVKYSIDISKSMGYEDKAHKFNWLYNVYCDLLVNYNSFNQELIDNINTIINQFSFVTPNRELESEKFEDRIRRSEYYKLRGKGKHGTYCHIFYLDFQIERLRELFKSEESFKKANFIEIRDAL